jgi:predicted RNA-binding protein with RPS1 domain
MERVCWIEGQLTLAIRMWWR